MNTKASLFRLTAVLLIVLGWSIPVFCGEIHDAAIKGDLAKVKALLKDNPELVSSQDSTGDTPLHLAVMKDHKDMVKLLIDNKADINASITAHVREIIHKSIPGFKSSTMLYFDIGATPLHLAAASGHKDIVELLLAHGADVNAIDGDDGWTPLHWAANGGHKDAAELLLANKADINAKDGYGRTPLYYAAGNKRINKGEVRWDDNIDSPVAIDGNTTMHLAELKSRKDAVAELLRQHGGHE
jgi:ankyrin repeat protein